MADIISQKKRSWNMSRIQSKDTAAEVKVRTYLFSRGFRYRKNVAKLPGKPDIVLPKFKTVIFVHGCFWHRHEGCKYAYTPKSRIEFWNDKFQKNIVRDKVVEDQLKEQGIRSLVIWECTVRKMMQKSNIESDTLNLVEDFLHSDREHEEL